MEGEPKEVTRRIRYVAIDPTRHVRLSVIEVHFLNFGTYLFKIFERCMSNRELSREDRK